MDKIIKMLNITYTILLILLHKKKLQILNVLKVSNILLGVQV